MKKSVRSQKKYTVYESLRMRLTRDDFENSGCLATLLLDTFFVRNGFLTAAIAIDARTCSEGDFSTLRKRLVAKEWLTWTPSQDGGARVRVGQKLLPYINKEKIKTSELVTKNEVYTKEEAASKVELQELRVRVEKLENAVEKAITVYLQTNPPDTKERRAKARKRFEEEGIISVV